MIDFLMFFIARIGVHPVPNLPLAIETIISLPSKGGFIF